ncbi:MAG: molybdopterin-binding protein [Coriobacteriia bacterium]|nr:molybdopterin-binding protein [Coriobacteriia bacterium]
MELLKVDTIAQAREKIRALAGPLFTRTVTVPLTEAAGLILAADIQATEDLPGFTRSTVDGYAVIAADTAGAGESIPVVLALQGAVEMGKPAAAGVPGGISAGQCAYIPTGGMLPAGADSVVMVEQSEGFGDQNVGIYGAVAPGENVIHAGDDAKAGAVLLKVGTRLRAQELGALAGAGFVRVPVFSSPLMAIISTGDEIIDPSATLQPGQVRDINTTALRAQAKACGYQVTRALVLPDVEERLSQRVAALMQSNDVVVLSGGSSQGEKDATARIIAGLADNGVLTHGLAVKPGKPTITGFDAASQTLLIGLPGHPLSAMMVFEVLLAWLLVEATGARHPLAVPATLAFNLATAAGKDTLQLVALSQGGAGDTIPTLIATPIHAKSGLITKLTEADGYLWIDRNTEGLRAGDTVAVHPFTM